MNATRPDRPLAPPWTTLLLATFIGCGADEPLGPRAQPPGISGNAAAGLEAFEASCASCHSSRDGIDLKFFAFPDTTIVRRAVAHVDTPTAHDIVAYVRTLPTLPAARDLRLFQPGGRPVAGDADFAVSLFGGDRWPSGLTATGLAAIDPLAVPIALPFPVWSLEGGNLDWMPDVAIADAVLDHPSEAGVGRDRLARYHATHAVDDLLLTVVALRVAERDPANAEAPCVMEPFDRFRPDDCFETRRWIASLVAQHMLRTGERAPIHRVLHDSWWDVGNAARRSRQTGEEIESAIPNWAQWMYLGWAFEPERHASVYLSAALNALGLPRHSTFHALRAMVVRGPDSGAPFQDVRTVARFAPNHWLYDALRFGYGHLIERLDAGVRLRRQEDIDEAAEAVESAWTLAARRLGATERDSLALLRDEVLARLEAIIPG